MRISRKMLSTPFAKGEKFALTIAALVLFLGVVGPTFAQQTVTVTIETNFSPHTVGIRPIQDAWVRELNNAVSSIRVAMFSFALVPFRNALIAANTRGVDVRVVADKDGLMRGANPSCLAVDLYNAGIPIKEYVPFVQSTLLHDKFLVIDEAVLVTGSANFSSSAVQFNHENSIIIKSTEGTPQFIADYRDQFEAMWNDAFADFNGSFLNWTPEGSCQ